LSGVQDFVIESSLTLRSQVRSAQAFD